MSDPISFQYTRKKVEKSGRILITPPNEVTYSEILTAETVLNNWRASHKHVLKKFSLSLKYQLQGNNAQLGQRLKMKKTRGCPS